MRIARWLIFCGWCCCASAHASLSVLASVRPVAMLVAAVGGTRVEVSVLIPSGAVPHDYRLKPSDLVKINNSELIVWGGAHYESFLAGVAEHLPESRRLDVGDDAVGYHFWMDPMATDREVQRIADALSRQDPAGADYYRANLAQFQQQLAVVNEQLRVRLLPYAGLAFIGTHDGVKPFTQYYGIRQSGMLQPESAHSGGVGLATLQALRVQVQTGVARCVIQDLEGTSTATTKLRIPPERIVDADIMGNRLPLSAASYWLLLNGVAASVEKCFADRVGAE